MEPILINNILFDHLDDNDKETQRIFTPPPSYDSASCLPTYKESCILRSSCERQESEFCTTSNPLCEDMAIVYIPKSNSAIDENALSSSENYSIENNLIQDPEPETPESSQQIGKLSTSHLQDQIPSRIINTAF